MGILDRLFGRRGRTEGARKEAAESPSIPVPDWVPRDVEEGFVKVRLFLSPADDVPSLYEIDLPEDGEESPGTLRCFSPPPESRGARQDVASRAWTVDVGRDETAELRELAGSISLFPVGPPMPSEEAATVELSLTAGQAEARIRWWMSPPREWSGVDRFVARLRELAQKEGVER